MSNVLIYFDDLYMLAKKLKLQSCSIHSMLIPYVKFFALYSMNKKGFLSSKKETEIKTLNNKKI